MEYTNTTQQIYADAVETAYSLYLDGRISDRERDMRITIANAELLDIKGRV
jgi:hypothetical protein